MRVTPFLISISIFRPALFPFPIYLSFSRLVVGVRGIKIQENEINSPPRFLKRDQGPIEQKC